MSLPDEKMLSVGQMSKLSCLSARQLRYYDEQDLVSPAYRDEQTGYRFYATHQLKDLMLLKLMNSLGLPLSSSRQLLKTRDTKKVCRELEAQLPILRTKFQETKNRYDQLVDIIMMMHDSISIMDTINSLSLESSIEVRQFPPQTVYTLRRIFDRDVRNERDYLSAYSKLSDETDALGLITTGPDMAVIRGSYADIFHADPSVRYGEIDFAVKLMDPPRYPVQGVRSLEGFLAVTGLHFGPRQECEVTYKRMTAWSVQKGITLSGEAIEEYLVNFYDDEDPGKHITRIYLPIRVRNSSNSVLL